MAVIGQALTTPEAGWRRFDNTLAAQQGVNHGVTGTQYFLTGNTSSYWIFRFRGTKLRIIGTRSTAGTTGSISIDGAVESIDYANTTSISQALVFEKLGLEDIEHTVIIKMTDATAGKYIYLDAMDVDDTGEVFREIGSPITAADAGWKRIDSSHRYIARVGTGFLSNSSTSHYMGDAVYIDKVLASKFVIKFSGTKIRLIMLRTTTGTKGKVTIDGVSEGLLDCLSGSPVYQAMVFEKTNLAPGFHKMEISLNDTAGYIWLDAIDVNETDDIYAVPGLFAIATPEAGWQRANNEWGFFGYVGTNWYEASHSSYYGGALFVSNSKSDYVTFKFYGTKLRIIGNTDPGRFNDLIVNIDGVEEHYTEVGTYVNVCLVYEKTDLPLGEHTVKIYPAATTTGVNWTIDAFDIDSTGRFVYGTGSYLPRPEHGWKRYDEVNPLFQRTGTWTSIAASAGFRGNRIYSTTVGSKITFQFTGSKIRLLTFTHPTAYSKVNKVRIDGVEQTFTLRYMAKPATYIGFNEQMIVFEKQGLAWGQHTVEIECSETPGTSFDAVDIDTEGWLGTTSDMLPQRTQVDAGWKRIESTDNYMGIVGDWSPDINDAYNSSSHCFFNVSGNARIWFKFSGTKLRLIMPVDLSFSDSVTMIIDGVSYPLNFSRSYLQYQSVLFEKTDLSEGDHIVHVNGLVTGKKVPWDAIEIDADDTLKPTLGSIIGNVAEDGWSRYQSDVDSLTTMWGSSWNLISGTYSNTYAYRSSNLAGQLNDYLTFRFRGTGARLIGTRGVHTNLKVSINGGPEEIFYANASGMGILSNMAITWEVVNLPEGVYDVRISKREAGYLYYDAVDIAPGGSLLPLLGSQYPVPETGWKRYDELMPGFDFDNSKEDVWLSQNVLLANGGFRKYTSTPGSKMRFTFTGPKLRLISYSTYATSVATDAKMTIDGVEYTLSHNLGSTIIREQAIIFEKLDFTPGVHEVVIEAMSTKTFYFDAVEVGANEYINSSAEYLALLKDGDDIKTHVVENSVGKWITIGTGQITDAMFVQGFNMGSSAAVASINQLAGTAQLYIKPKPGVDFKTGIRMLATPTPQLVIGNDDIDISEMVIERISLANVKSGAGKIYMVLSTDSGATWRSFKNGSWLPVDMTNIPGLLQTAMTVEEVQALRQEHFTTFDEDTKMRFAYLLYKDVVADRAETDTLNITVDLKGTWRRGIYGTEWDMDYTNNRTISIKLAGNGTYKINY